MIVKFFLPFTDHINHWPLLVAGRVLELLGATNLRRRSNVGRNPRFDEDDCAGKTFVASSVRWTRAFFTP
jgi:hypothetical protein